MILSYSIDCIARNTYDWVLGSHHSMDKHIHVVNINTHILLIIWNILMFSSCNLVLIIFLLAIFLQFAHRLPAYACDLSGSHIYSIDF